MELNSLLSVAEFAKEIGVGSSRVRQLVMRGEISSILKSGIRLIGRSEIKKYQKTRRKYVKSPKVAS